MAQRRDEARPIFEGSAEMIVLPGVVHVRPPADVVVPPGYEIQTFLTQQPRLSARFKVVPSKGWWARYLRWRFPWRQR